MGAGRGERETSEDGDYMRLSRSKFEEVQNKIKYNLHSTALETRLMIDRLILIDIYYSLRLR